MSVLFTLYYLSAPDVQALSVPGINPRETSSCDDLRHCTFNLMFPGRWLSDIRENLIGRTIWNIVWSCLVTIFACTWVAVHPNIPDPDEKWVRIASRRVGITIMALIAPELVIVWAIRQWINARKLAQMYKGGCIISYKFEIGCR